ncbi:hypothetical protein DKX38_006612 [Salix brachista]|uniref:DOG1 domain-containing protein n=1 Tax=Salix brachista TaxID=2182728 RepID=A0A5N5N298_9ROSI|nr:hypothetical protein DKX38_006612 [Salix brachista]
MASHRVGETGLSNSLPSNHHLPCALVHGINTPSSSYINQGGSAFDFGGLEEAIVLQGVQIRNDEAKAPLFTGSSRSGGESTDSGSATNTLSSKADAHLEPESPISKRASFSDHYNQAFEQKHLQFQEQQQVNMANDTSRTGGGPSQQNQSPAITPHEKRKVSTSENPLDSKTLRRLAQNREAARKSRLRKKAYVQQLETSRIKLSQLEQDLQRARQQGLFLGGAGGNISSGPAIFDMEYARWLEEDHQLMSELRTALHAHLSDGELRATVDGYISHYDEIFRLKVEAAKSDVFHLITGMWSTPAERCFLWIGGFRPSELIKMLISQLDPLTEQQVMGIYSLQHSSQQAEEALSQGLEQLQQSLVDTIAGGPVTGGMQQMVVALGKLSNLEGFLRQVHISLTLITSIKYQTIR